MSTTSVWIPISSAVAALLGGGIGAMLQGRYGVSGWRRQIRIQAYMRFVETTHDFNDCLTDALDAIGKPDFEDNWKKLREAYWQMGRAGSQTSIAGPISVDIAAQRVVVNARELLEGGKDSGVLFAIAAATKKNGSNEKRDLWTRSVSEFGIIVRKTLGTQGWLLYRRTRRIVVYEDGRVEFARPR